MLILHLGKARHRGVEWNSQADIVTPESCIRPLSPSQNLHATQTRALFLFCASTCEQWCSCWMEEHFIHLGWMHKGWGWREQLYFISTVFHELFTMVSNTIANRTWGMLLERYISQRVWQLNWGYIFSSVYCRTGVLFKGNNPHSYNVSVENELEAQIKAPAPVATCYERAFPL